MGLWKDIFGESQAEAWRRLAQEIGAVNVEPNWGRGRAVHAQLGGFDIVLDTYTVSTGKTTVTYTRLRAPFVNARGLRFNLYRASIFSGLAKLLGQQDLEIGVPEFDRDFIIQGNDLERVKQILGDAALRALIVAQPRVRVSIENDEGLFGPKYGNGVDVLSFVEGGVIKDVSRLRGLFSMFAALLNAFGDGAKHFLEVPNAELPASFHRVIDTIVESLGASAERVGDTIEARIPDPLGLGVQARVVTAIPSLPGLLSSLRMEATLPSSTATFSVTKRGLMPFGAMETGDKAVDDALAIKGDASQVQRALRPLRVLASVAPTIDGGNESLVLETKDVAADLIPSALAAALDLWQEIARARAGL